MPITQSPPPQPQTHRCCAPCRPQQRDRVRPAAPPRRGREGPPSLPSTPRRRQPTRICRLSPPLQPTSDGELLARRLPLRPPSSSGLARWPAHPSPACCCLSMLPHRRSTSRACPGQRMTTGWSTGCSTSGGWGWSTSGGRRRMTTSRGGR
jgi:hypothetical protein